MGITNFPYGITSFGQLVPNTFGVGNVYYVWLTSKTAIMTDMKNKYEGNTYPDGNKILYEDAGNGLGIQAAIDACKGGRNDYVIVGTGNYNLTVPLTMSGKSSVHLIGCNGGGLDVGSLGAAALTQTGNYENVIMEAYGELSGFQIINKAGYSAVTMADGKWRMNIHNNYFHMVQGSASYIVKASGSGLAYGTIANNRFETYVAGNSATVIDCAGATAANICSNWICNLSGTIDTGIQTGSGYQMMIVDNIVSDCSGAGTITVAIDMGQKNTAINNRLAVLSGRGFANGTVNRTFVDNRDATSGGATPIET
jgi:hypothetical protein